MEKIKRGSLVLPKGTTAARVKRKKLADAVAKRREAKAVGQEAGVFISKARNANVKKTLLMNVAPRTKSTARMTGGTSAGIKRTAEAAIGRIATGKVLKGMARAGGVLGMVAVFNAALNDSTKKNKGN